MKEALRVIGIACCTEALTASAAIAIGIVAFLLPIFLFTLGLMWILGG